MTPYGDTETVQHWLRLPDGNEPLPEPKADPGFEVRGGANELKNLKTGEGGGGGFNQNTIILLLYIYIYIKYDISKILFWKLLGGGSVKSHGIPLRALTQDLKMPISKTRLKFNCQNRVQISKGQPR